MTTAEAEKTYVCSVVFLDIVQFSQQANAVQSAWRVELAAILERGLTGMEPDHRIIVDTGDGAAIGFLWNPEEALQFTRRLLEELSTLKSFALRVGAHIGPLRVVRGMNGHPNIVGDGINAAQRVMGFAEPNEVLVSRSFHEAVIWLSTENPALFSPYGKQADKHGREHDLYRMGTTKAKPVPQMTSATPPDPAILAPPARTRSTNPEKSTPKLPLVYALAAIVLVSAGVGASLLFRNIERPPATTAEAPSAAEKTLLAAPVAKPLAAAPKPAALVATPSLAREPTLARSTNEKHPTKQALRADNNESGTASCTNCSCSDLMTKLSLGVPLGNEERRYLQERCKQ